MQQTGTHVNKGGMGGCGSEVESASCNQKVRWFDSLALHVEVSLDKIPNPKLLLMWWSAPGISV